jgi:hypothetical protein
MTFEQIAIVAGIVVIVVMAVLYLRRQSGSEGPPVGFIPRFLRPIANAWFGVMNWPIPYDGEGELIPEGERKRSRD